MPAIIRCGFIDLPTCYPKDKDIHNYNFFVALYECETWSPKLREEYKLRALENRAAMKTFGRKRNGVTRESIRLHNEELKIRITHPLLFG